MTLRFANTGQQGAVFHVYDRLHLDRIPRRYTVEAGKTLDDTAWTAPDDGGSYDLDVYSANGFVRTFKGNVRKAGAAALNLQVAYDVRGGTVRAQLRNLGTVWVKFRIVANEYRTDGPWTLPDATSMMYQYVVLLSIFPSFSGCCFARMKSLFQP